MSSPATPYGASLHEAIGEGSLRSARVVVPILLRSMAVGSVVDFGCGAGNWLSAFHENGLRDILGYDGDYVDTGNLRIDPACFVARNLEREDQVTRRFDLAISLEVAEHLPTARAAGFVDLLVRSAPAVLFGAAIPGQGGVHHVNEQWPDYWRALNRTRSEEHTSELQSHSFISYAVF